MKGSIRHALTGAALFGCACAATAAEAAVFVCANAACSSWTAITPAQRSLTPTGKTGPTVDQALGQSLDIRVVNGFKSEGGWDLFLNNLFWHLGGSVPITGGQHLTAYVYKNGAFMTSCHVFDVKVARGYTTSCLSNRSRARTPKRR